MVRKTYIIFICAVLLCAIPGYSRNGNTDSLKKVVASEKDPHKLIGPLTDLCFYYSDNCSDSVIPMAYRLINLARNLKMYYYVVEGNTFLAKNFRIHMQMDSARKHLREGFESSNGNSRVMTNAWISYFDFYQSIGLSDSALYSLFRAQDEAVKSKDIVQQAVVLNRIGNFYLDQKVYDKALTYCFASLRIWEQANKKNKEGILSDIGNIYYYLGNYGKALEYYRKAYEVSIKINNILGFGYSLNNIGLVYSKLGEHDTALQYYGLSLSYYRKTNNQKGISNVLINLAREELGKRNIQDALSHAREALSLATTLQFKDLMLASYAILADAYEQQGNYKLANENRKMQVAYTDSNLNVTMVHKVADMQTKYEVSRRDAENHALKAEQAQQALDIQQQKYVISFVVIVLILIVLVALNYRKLSRGRKERLQILQQQHTLIEAKNKELAELNNEMQEQKKALEETNAFKNKLFSIVSHDVRSPLSSLTTLIMFLAGGDDLPHKTIVAMLKDLAERVQQTTNFLDNLLSWAKSQLDGYVPDVQEIGLRTEVDSIFGLYHNQLSKKNIEVYNNIPTDVTLTTDMNLLKLILRNLINNAIKFTPVQGHIRVDTQQDDNNIVVSVKDSGIGIIKEAQDKLFLGKGYTTLGTDKEKGTGLGLTLCKDFIERLGGHIWVESQIGEGSTFSFSVPVKVKEAVTADA